MGMRSSSAPAIDAGHLAHIRWIVGGTCAGKSSIARVLAACYGVAVYNGDRAEHGWLDRANPRDHPHWYPESVSSRGETWLRNSGRQLFQSMASLHGETTAFVIEDLLALSPDRTVLVDYFGLLPTEVAPLLLRPEQAAVLVPTPEFRRRRLGDRYSDPLRAKANWGAADPAAVLPKRLERDALWDAEVTRRAVECDLPITSVDGSRPVEELADELATRFGLRPDGWSRRPLTR